MSAGAKAVESRAEWMRGRRCWRWQWAVSRGRNSWPAVSNVGVARVGENGADEGDDADPDLFGGPLNPQGYWGFLLGGGVDGHGLMDGGGFREMEEELGF